MCNGLCHAGPVAQAVPHWVVPTAQQLADCHRLAAVAGTYGIGVAALADSVPSQFVVLAGDLDRH